MFLSFLESEGGLLGNQRMEQVEDGSQKEPVGTVAREATGSAQLSYWSCCLDVWGVGLQAFQ